MNTTNRPPGRLQRGSRIFRSLAQLGVAVTLITVAAQLLVAAAPLWKGGPVAATGLKVLEQLVLCVPALCYVISLMRAQQVFARIGRGDLFVLANSSGLRSVGIALSIGAVWAMCAAGLNDMQHDPYGLHSSAEDAAQIALAALGLALMMIGRVMGEAIALKTENDGFV